jgi:ribosomal protein S18 acetylase RimI-like enzyme
VRTPYRGRGIGQALLDAAEEALVRAGANHAVIAVARTNHEARRLYERRGYTWIADDPGSWSYPDERGKRRYVSEPAHVLARRLPDS